MKPSYARTSARYVQSPVRREYGNNCAYTWASPATGIPRRDHRCQVGFATKFGPIAGAEEIPQSGKRDLAQSSSGNDGGPIRGHPRNKRGEVEARGSFGTCLQRSLTGPGRERPRQRHDFPAKWRRDCGRYRPSSTVLRTWHSGWDVAQVWGRGRSRLLRLEDEELSGRRFQGTC